MQASKAVIVSLLLKYIYSSIGAGDTFIAGVLYSLICRKDWALDYTLEFANELAGRKVIQEGFAGLGKLMRLSLGVDISTDV